MKKSLLSLALSVSLLTALPVSAASTVTLHDLLTMALERNKGLNDDQITQISVSQWLTGATTLSANYLNSQQSQGSDEAELRLTFPLKSPGQHDNDHALTVSNRLIQQRNKNLRQWYFSGLIREAIWSYLLVDTQIKAIEDKQALLLQLKTQFAKQVDAGTSSKLGLLLAQQEYLSTKTQRVGLEQQQAQWLKRLQQLTGHDRLPDNVIESRPEQQQWLLNEHPQVTLLRAEMQQALQVLKASAVGMQPWNVSVTAKRINNPALSENQIGLGIDIPLGGRDTLTQADQSDWLRTRAQYEVQLDNLYQDLQQQWLTLDQQWQTLKQQQALLGQQVVISHEILKQVDLLKQRNEIEQELFLNRTLRAMEIQSAQSINQIQLYQNQARLNQAAGVSL
ncbi:TolC family protein [Neptunicella marina]|uniref:TolC family protein n=1 Tax=Neptunicella marina TaxID=2125989 RepID=A0A8J6M2N4_9ALTE|nr:TolC family protein [Neptunicella marina]MBC3766508.1 TolC family protein [Neptunicella marina]